MIWVEGEAGIGKSALVNRFGEGLARSRTVLRGRCLEVDGAPTAWAWREVLDAAGVDAGALGVNLRFPLQLAAALLPALAGEVDGPAPAVLLDDLHCADDETLAVLRHVLGGSSPVLVVATYRGGEVTPASRPRSPPCRGRCWTGSTSADSTSMPRARSCAATPEERWPAWCGHSCWTAPAGTRCSCAHSA